MNDLAPSTGNLQAKSRKTDPIKWAAELARDRARYHAGNKRVRKARYERLKAGMSPVEFRAFQLRRNHRNPELTAEWLQSVWDRQEGLCALTGRCLEWDRCEVDHRIPRSRGGTNALDNFRLVCTEANAAKHNLLDCELAGLCRDILRTLANG